MKSTQIKNELCRVFGLQSKQLKISRRRDNLLRVKVDAERDEIFQIVRYVIKHHERLDVWIYRDDYDVYDYHAKFTNWDGLTAEWDQHQGDLILNDMLRAFPRYVITIPNEQDAKTASDLNEMRLHFENFGDSMTAEDVVA